MSWKRVPLQGRQGRPMPAKEPINSKENALLDEGGRSF